MNSKAQNSTGRGKAITGVNAQQANSPGETKAPLYVQVARELKQEIVSGLHPVGALLPTEDELCKRFSVSRYTVREALRILREEGLVSSRQGAGTVVIPPRSIGDDIHQVMSINDLVDFAIDARLVIDSIKMVSIDSQLAEHTGLPVGEEWLQVCGFRRVQGTDEPVCKTDYYINRAYAAVGRLLQRHTGPIFPLLEDMFGQTIVEVHQQITATLISDTTANELKVNDGSAALEVRRTYSTADGKVAQVTINTHPASRFRHSMTMRRVRA